MNKPIRNVSIVVLLMFIALMANVTYANIARQDPLNARPENRRVIDARFSQDRGSIMVGNTEIAFSEPSKGRFKYLRNYPQAELYAPVTGYYSYTYGNSALENSQSSYLSGSNDVQLLDRLIKAAAGTTPKGASVETTISAKAQEAAWKELAGRKGAVVALDYSTGAIKALVSAPSYDPNQLATHDLAAATKTWKQLNADPDKPMLNRATREIFSPGSTFKLVTAAAALENNDLRADSKIDASTFELPGSTKTINGSCGGKSITLQHALQVSCNPAFARLGAELGAEKLAEQAEKFGFGQRYLPEIGAVASRFPSDIDSAQTAMSAIGEYETAASPLQMAMVAGAIANNGSLMRPYVVDRILSEDLSVLSESRPEKDSQAVSPTTAAELQQMMESVVADGTGSRAKISGLTVGGKTGTAVTDRVRLPYAWFVAYAKEINIAVAVLIQDAGSTTASEVAGSRLSAPIAKSVLEALR